MLRLNKTVCSTSYSSKAFTLIEIMIVVAIIGIIAAIAIPNYLQAVRKSQCNACVANLRALMGAMEQCRLIEGGAEEISMDKLCQPVAYIKGEPRCPYNSSEPYDISGASPVCPNLGARPDHVYP